MQSARVSDRRLIALEVFSRGCSSLKEEGCPLWRTIHDMAGFKVEIFPMMVYLTDFVRIRVRIRFRILLYRIICPGALP